MNKWLIAILACALGGCLSLPGSDSAAPARYMLQGPGGSCVPAQRSLLLDVTSVGAGLDTDRIAQLQESTGEVTWLKDVRWVRSAGAMLEDRLASDLECRGFAVQTGHRVRSGGSQLQCELRALNLVERADGREARIALSCLYRGGDEAPESALLESARAPLARWSADAAVGAFNAAYADVFDSLYAGIATAG